MEVELSLLDKIKSYGVGRRQLDDVMFVKDEPLPRLGVYDFDDAALCHHAIKARCNIPGCSYTAVTLLDYENHYNAAHRYSCSECKKKFLSPHFLDLHIQETHDSFFAVFAERTPSYCCYIQECKEKFKTAEERSQHCIENHKVPKDFRFESKPKGKSSKKNKGKKNAKPNETKSMELDDESTSQVKTKIVLSTSKTKTFSPEYTGRIFTKSKNDTTPRDINMDDVMADLKESLEE